MNYSELYLEAYNEYKQENYQLALSLYHKELSLRNRNGLAYLCKAKTHIKLAEYEKAQISFNTCLNYIDSTKKQRYVIGYHRFLLKNNQTKQAVEHIINELTHIGKRERVQLLLIYILDDSIKDAKQFISKNSISANNILATFIEESEDFAPDLQKITADLFMEYLKDKQVLLVQKVEDTNAFIDNLNASYGEVKADFSALAELSKSMFTDSDNGFTIIKKGEVFFKDELPKALQRVEQEKNRAEIAVLLSENQGAYDAYLKISELYLKSSEFAGKKLIITIESHFELFELHAEIVDQHSILSGHNAEMAEVVIKEFSKYTQEMADGQVELVSILRTEYDRLLKRKNIFKAHKIALLLYKVESKNTHYLKARKIRNYFNISALVLTILLIVFFVYFQQNKIYEEEQEVAYNRAITEKRHSEYVSYLDSYEENDDEDDIKKRKNIQKLHEILLYETVFKKNDIKAINTFVKYYPNSKHLKTIRFSKKWDKNILLSLVGEYKFGFGTLNFKKESTNSYRVPIGLTVKYAFNKTGYLSDTKAFVVVDNIEIKPTLKRDKNKEGITPLFAPPYYVKNRVYFCNTSDVNVREGSSMYSETITTIKRGTPVKYLGEKGVRSRSAKLINQDVDPNDFYYKFQLLNGIIGWIHGSTLAEVEDNKDIDFSVYKKHYLKLIDIENR